MRNISAGLMAVAVVVSASAALAADAGITCETGKLKLTAKYGSCRLAAVSKGLKADAPPEYTKCSLDKFTDVETKAEGACPTTSDAPDVEQRVTYHTDAIADLLSGVYPADRYFPASGQTASYGVGDDGDLQPGATLAYTDNADGTITDRNTGLIWEKKVGYTGAFAHCTSEAGTCANPHNAGNLYYWTAGSPYTAYNGSAVSIFLNQLNNRCDKNTAISCASDADCSVPGGACGFVGHRDWRLPSITELRSLVDFSIPSPGPVVSAAFHGANCGAACTDITSAACSCTANDVAFWSATTYASNQTEAWFVNFFVGQRARFSKGINNHVRAVRNGS